MGLIDVIKKGAFVDILRGMSVTGTYLLSEKVTVEYPQEKVQPAPRFRGAHALLTDPETGDTKCVACMLCATICPSRCISIAGEVTPEGRSRPATFDLDLARCIFCGMCEEVCPLAAIVMTSEYELATFDKQDFLLSKERLLANQENARKEVFVEPAAAEPAEAPVAIGVRAAVGAGAKAVAILGVATGDAGALPPGTAEGKRILKKEEERRHPW